MFRPNLFRTLIFPVLFLTSSGVYGQQFAGQQPGVSIPRSQYQAPTLDYYQGQRGRIWDDQQPIEQLMGSLAERSWLRVDYLHWTFSRPGGQSIGASVLNAPDPLVVFDNINGTAAGEALIPQMGNMALDDSSGIRGTWGLDLQNADLELEFFGTEQNTDSISFTNLAVGRAVGAEAVGTTARPNIVTPLMTGGSVSDSATANYLIYDSSFQSTLSSQVWGAEATLLSESYVQGPGLTWQWLGGFRYMAYEEEFRNRGISNGGGLLTDTISSFGGQTVNNVYGPEVGGRISAESKWFTFSATPRIAFALNDYTAQTRSSPLGATEVQFSSSDVEFTPLVQVSFVGEIHMTPHISLFGGYDFMWIYKMSRPFDNLVYDSSTGLAGGFTPEISQQVNLKSFYARGLSAGFVVRY